jgi:hypothetical protein
MLNLAVALVLATQWPEKEWAFKPVEAGATSPIKEQDVVIMRTQDELRRYMIRRGSPRRPLPTIDWKMNQVIAVHVGARPTASYTAAVKHLWKTPNGAEIEVAVSGPAPDVIVAQVITYPFVMVRTERFPGTVNFKLQETP